MLRELGQRRAWLITLCGGGGGAHRGLVHGLLVKGQALYKTIISYSQPPCRRRYCFMWMNVCLRKIGCICIAQWWFGRKSVQPWNVRCDLPLGFIWLWSWMSHFLSGSSSRQQGRVPCVTPRSSHLRTPRGAYQDVKWKTTGPEGKGRSCSPRGIVAFQRGVIVRQDAGPTSTPCQTLGQSFLDLSERWVWMSSKARTISSSCSKTPKETGWDYFFLVSYFDPNLSSLFKSLLILSAVEDRGSLLC